MVMSRWRQASPGVGSLVAFTPFSPFVVAVVLLDARHFFKLTMPCLDAALGAVPLRFASRFACEIQLKTY